MPEYPDINELRRYDIESDFEALAETAESSNAAIVKFIVDLLAQLQTDRELTTTEVERTVISLLTTSHVNVLRDLILDDSLLSKVAELISSSVVQQETEGEEGGRSSRSEVQTQEPAKTQEPTEPPKTEKTEGESPAKTKGGLTDKQAKAAQTTVENLVRSHRALITQGGQELEGKLSGLRDKLKDTSKALAKRRRALGRRWRELSRRLTGETPTTSSKTDVSTVVQVVEGGLTTPSRTSGLPTPRRHATTRRTPTAAAKQLRKIFKPGTGVANSTKTVGQMAKKLNPVGKLVSQKSILGLNRELKRLSAHEEKQRTEHKSFIQRIGKSIKRTTKKEFNPFEQLSRKQHEQHWWKRKNLRWWLYGIASVILTPAGMYVLGYIVGSIEKFFKKILEPKDDDRTEEQKRKDVEREYKNFFLTGTTYRVVEALIGEKNAKAIDKKLQLIGIVLFGKKKVDEIIARNEAKGLAAEGLADKDDEKLAGKFKKGPGLLEKIKEKFNKVTDFLKDIMQKIAATTIFQSIKENGGVVTLQAMAIVMARRLARLGELFPAVFGSYLVMKAGGGIRSVLGLAMHGGFSKIALNPKVMAGAAILAVTSGLISAVVDIVSAEWDTMKNAERTAQNQKSAEHNIRNLTSGLTGNTTMGYISTPEITATHGAMGGSGKSFSDEVKQTAEEIRRKLDGEEGPKTIAQINDELLSKDRASTLALRAAARVKSALPQNLRPTGLGLPAAPSGAPNEPPAPQVTWTEKSEALLNAVKKGAEANVKDPTKEHLPPKFDPESDTAYKAFLPPEALNGRNHIDEWKFRKCRGLFVMGLVNELENNRIDVNRFVQLYDRTWDPEDRIYITYMVSTGKEKPWNYLHNDKLNKESILILGEKLFGREHLEKVRKERGYNATRLLTSEVEGRLSNMSRTGHELPYYAMFLKYRMDSGKNDASGRPIFKEDAGPVNLSDKEWTEHAVTMSRTEFGGEEGLGQTRLEVSAERTGLPMDRHELTEYGQGVSKARDKAAETLALTLRAMKVSGTENTGIAQYIRESISDPVVRDQALAELDRLVIDRTTEFQRLAKARGLTSEDELATAAQYVYNTVAKGTMEEMLAILDKYSAKGRPAEAVSLEVEHAPEAPAQARAEETRTVETTARVATEAIETGEAEVSGLRAKLVELERDNFELVGNIAKNQVAIAALKATDTSPGSPFAGSFRAGPYSPDHIPGIPTPKRFSDPSGTASSFSNFNPWPVYIPSVPSAAQAGAGVNFP